MQIKRVKISDLNSAAHNPKERIKDTKQLEKSIIKYGLIYPIAVSKDMTIIDGHRRLHACTMLGWDQIPIIIVEADDPDSVYADVNANSTRLSGSQNLSVWLANPGAVTPTANTRFKNWETLVGRPTLKRIYKAGMSIRLLRVAKRIAEYVESDDPKFLVVITNWLISNRNARLTEAYMMTNHSAKKLYQIIKSGKVLNTTFAS